MPFVPRTRGPGHIKGFTTPIESASWTFTDIVSGASNSTGTIVEAMIGADTVSGSDASTGSLVEAKIYADVRSGADASTGSLVDAHVMVNVMSGVSISTGALGDTLVASDLESGYGTSSGSETDVYTPPVPLNPADGEMFVKTWNLPNMLPFLKLPTRNVSTPLGTAVSVGRLRDAHGHSSVPEGICESIGLLVSYSYRRTLPIGEARARGLLEEVHGHSHERIGRARTSEGYVLEVHGHGQRLTGRARAFGTLDTLSRDLRELLELGLI